MEQEIRDAFQAPLSPSVAVRKLLQSRPASPSRSQPDTPFNEPVDLPPSDDLKRTLHDLQNLLLQYLRLLPFLPSNHPIRIRLKKLLTPATHLITSVLAKSLHSRKLLASNLVYDLAVLFWKWVINLFFREIRPRGAWRIPRDGALIFVCAPHHNQFVDPLLLMSEGRLSGSRRIAFLTAEASMNRAFVGAAAKTMQSIPVSRAQDSKKRAKGLVYLDPSEDDDARTIVGHETTFTSYLKPKFQIMLPKIFKFKSFEIEAVIDDTHLRLKRAIEDEKIKEALRSAGRRVQDGGQLEANGLVGIQQNGIEFSWMPYIDQTQMYASVYKRLREGGCIGIFPEGGSHDRTELLPLKAGVAIMALGALAENPGLKLQIMPTGLYYFHPHRFRSRAVIEFGSPLTIPQELVDQFKQGGAEKRDAIAKVLDLVFDGLKSVTVQSPDYDTLMLIQATRRLYRPPGHQLSLGQVVELNKRFIIGYDKYKDEPRVVALKERVREYNKLLQYMGLKDHQVERDDRSSLRSLVLLVYRSLLVTGWGLVALPGVIFNAPMFIAATVISRKRAKEALAASTVKIQARDVVATWKILVSLGMAPVVYTIYGIIGMFLAYKYNYSLRYKIAIPFVMAILVPSIGYSALKFGETGMDIYKSLRPLFLSIMPGNQKYLDRLREMRANLSNDLSELIEEFGPKLFEDFEGNRVVPTTNTGQERKNSYGKQQSGGFFTHPFSWIDTKIWGWSPGPSEDEDYDGAVPEGRRSRSRSQVNLAALTEEPEIISGKSTALQESAEIRQRHT